MITNYNQQINQYKNEPVFISSQLPKYNVKSVFSKNYTEAGKELDKQEKVAVMTNNYGNKHFMMHSHLFHGINQMTRGDEIAIDSVHYVITGSKIVSNEKNFEAWKYVIEKNNDVLQTCQTTNYNGNVIIYDLLKLNLKQ